jgi:hypothetical protein
MTKIAMWLQSWNMQSRFGRDTNELFQPTNQQTVKPSNQLTDYMGWSHYETLLVALLVSNFVTACKRAVSWFNF